MGTRSKAEGLEGVQWSTRCGGHSGYESGMGWLKGRLTATLLSVLASISLYTTPWSRWKGGSVYRTSHASERATKLQLSPCCFVDALAGRSLLRW